MGQETNTLSKYVIAFFAGGVIAFIFTFIISLILSYVVEGGLLSIFIILPIFWIISIGAILHRLNVVEKRKQNLTK